MSNKENSESQSSDVQNKIISLLKQKEDELIIAKNREEDYRELLKECIKEKIMLRESIKKFKIIIEKIEEGVLLEDVEGLISFVNPRVTEILGYEKEELLGKHWSVIVPSEELEKFYFESAKRPNGISSTYETSLLTKDRRRIPVIINSTPISSEDGDYKRVLSVFTDIKKLKKAENSLKRTEELNRMLVELSPDAITLTDLDANIVMVNKQAAVLLGYDNQNELTGKSTYDLIAPNDHIHALKNTKKILEQGIIRNEEYTMIRKDGSLLPAELSATFITDDLGSPIAYMATMRDITMRKKAQEERQRLEERRRDFVDRTAHELRTPLTVIQGYTEFLLKREKKKQKVHIMNKILKNVHRLENLANSVSNIYRIEKEEFDLTFGEIEMQTFMSSFLEPYINQYEGQIRWIDSQSKDQVIIEGDKSKLTTALVNVLDNSIKNTTSENREISLEMVVSEREVKLMISDNGAGIEPKYLERIFGKFESIPTKYDVTGTGIGLYIAREIIKAHYGSIYAYSEGEDTGTTVTIRLPRVFDYS